MIFTACWQATDLIQQLFKRGIPTQKRTSSQGKFFFRLNWHKCSFWDIVFYLIFSNHGFLPFISSRILAGLRPICPSEKSAEAYKALQMNMSSKVSERLSRPITWQWRPFFITFVNCIDFRHDNKFIKSSEMLRLCQLNPKDGKRKKTKTARQKRRKQVCITWCDQSV